MKEYNINIDSFWYKEISLYVITTINNHKYINIGKDINKLKPLTRLKD